MPLDTDPTPDEASTDPATTAPADAADLEGGTDFEMVALPRSLAHRSRIVTCFSPKGGVGCSMIATNLAVALQRRSRPTVLFDGSLSNGTVDTFLGLGPSNAILHLIHHEDAISAFSVQKALVR